MSVSYQDIVNHIKKLLSANFVDYHIYDDAVRENMKRPSFNINLLPEMSSNFNRFYREQTVMVDVAYFSEEESDLQSKAKNLDMAYKLQNVFNYSLSVLDRNLHIDNLTYNITDDRVLHVIFNLNWFNENEVTVEWLKQFNIIKEIHFRDGFSIFSSKCAIITSDGKYYRAIDGGFYVECTPEEVALLKSEYNLTM